jgi:hypothetical protein
MYQNGLSVLHMKRGCRCCALTTFISEHDIPLGFNRSLGGVVSDSIRVH